MKPYKKLLNDKGLTMMELLVSLAILLLVLGIGYNFYYFLNKSFKDTETKWVKQREVRKAADFINEELKTAYSLTTSNNTSPSGSEEDQFIYLSANKIMYKNGTSGAITLADSNVKIEFGRVKDKDGNDISNVINYKISSLDIDYSVDSSVLLSNMTEAKSIVGSTSGTAIEFKNVGDISAIPSTELGAFCFIATAAYGSNTEPSVMLLRQFRDEVLLRTGLGTEFVEYYYKNSPPIAQKIAGSKVLKNITLVLLMPIVGGVVLFMHKEVYLLLMLFILLKIYMDRKKKPGLY